MRSVSCENITSIIYQNNGLRFNVHLDRVFNPIPHPPSWTRKNFADETTFRGVAEVDAMCRSFSTD